MPALWPIVIAFVIVAFVWMAVRIAGNTPSKPEWMRRQEQQDWLNSWRKLPRVFRLIVQMSWVANFAAILRWGALFNTYMLYSPSRS